MADAFIHHEPPLQSPTGARADWPFWAPATDRAVARALRLARIRPGERFLDLGCGDGRVLLAAARRGAHVIGVESDAELVEVAQRALADAGVDGEVVLGDAATVNVEADVVFTYLSPATLQRLRRRLQRFRPGTRLVSIDYGVTGLVPSRVVGGVHMYSLPAAAAPLRQPPTWASEGTLIAAVPECHSLTSLEIVHPGGPVVVAGDDALARTVEIETGADEALAGEAIAIDLRWHELDAGTLVVGELTVVGLPAHLVVSLISDSEPGMWELSDEGCTNIRRRLARPPLPRSIATLLSAAEGARVP